MPYEFQITRRVEFAETDMEGIMHFSNFFRFMETAEHAFFRSLGYSIVLARSGLAVGLPRVHAECDYEAPVHFEDEIRVQLLVERKGKHSLTYQFLFHRLNDSAQVAHGRLVVASAARQKDGSFKSVPLPRQIADKILEAPKEMLFPSPERRSKARGGRRAIEGGKSKATNHHPVSRI